MIAYKTQTDENGRAYFRDVISEIDNYEIEITGENINRKVITNIHLQEFLKDKDDLFNMPSTPS